MFCLAKIEKTGILNNLSVKLIETWQFDNIGFWTLAPELYSFKPNKKLQ